MLIGASPETPLARQWVLPNTGKWGRVNCVAALDVTKDDVADVVVGRDDGRLQVFSFDADADGSPQLAFERTLGEGIHSVEMGTISTPGYDDVVCATYTGKVISVRGRCCFRWCPRRPVLPPPRPTHSLLLRRSSQTSQWTRRPTTRTAARPAS